MLYYFNILLAAVLWIQSLLMAYVYFVLSSWTILRAAYCFKCVLPHVARMRESWMQPGQKRMQKRNPGSPMCNFRQYPILFYRRLRLYAYTSGGFRGADLENGVRPLLFRMLDPPLYTWPCFNQTNSTFNTLPVAYATFHVLLTPIGYPQFTRF